MPKRKLNATVTVAVVGAAAVILAAFFSSFGSAISAYITSHHPEDKEKPSVIVQVMPQIVPPVLAKEVLQLNPETGASEIETLRDVSMWDLRSWKRVPLVQANTRYSPVNYVNYLHVRKLREAKTYRAHYSTSGALIDIRCITHPYTVLQRTGLDTAHPGEGKKTYELDVDVGDAQVGHEFLIVIEATYWNNFQEAGSQEVATYTDEDMRQMDELAIFILMPESKPFHNPQRWQRVTSSETREPYDGNERFYTDKDGRFMYWSIQNRRPNHHYQLTWDW